MAVPNIFATATSSIPLSQLDTNFATAITLGSTALYLGNTTTSVAGLTVTGGAFNGTVGSTTPSTGAFTTGTFSSTLGVTGVATLGNGAILGTPASGTVTNLTGTASININGTVGATTATTGAFTTISATGITTVAAGSAALPAIVSTTGTADTGLWFPAADTVAASTAGAERMRIDSSGNVLVTNPAGLGYGTGSGGTVTQATSKTTGVTLNKPTGQITMNNAALAANTTARFLVTNSIASVTDCIMVTIRDGVTAGAYLAWVDGTANGSFTMAVRNITAGSLSDAVVLNFSVIKGATS